MNVRAAKLQDLNSVVKMLADDKLGELREDASSPINQAYVRAFKHIDQDLNNELIVAENNTQM